MTTTLHETADYLMTVPSAHVPERALMSGRTHPKVLAPPLAGAVFVVVLVWVAAPQAGALLAAAGSGTALFYGWAAVGELPGWVWPAAVTAVAVCWAGRAVVRWASSRWIVTTQRVLVRTGLIWTCGHDLPLARVVNLEMERGLLDRIVGCGTLVLVTAAQDPMVLSDIPQVERVRARITGLIGG